VTRSDSPDVWGERSEGEKPRKVSTARRLRSPGDSTNSSQARSPVGGASSDRSLGNGRATRVTSGGQGPRKGHLLRSRRTPWRAKPRDAPALRRREDGEEGREGGNQTSDVARGGGGTRCPGAESPTGKCRRAGKPRRGSIAETLERRPSGRSHEAVVRGCGDMSLKGRESARRAFGRLRPAERLVERTPKGRTQTPHGSSGNPYPLWFFGSESSKCRETP